jgi:hypothetical protein
LSPAGCARVSLAGLVVAASVATPPFTVTEPLAVQPAGISPKPTNSTRVSG